MLELARDVILSSLSDSPTRGGADVSKVFSITYALLINRYCAFNGSRYQEA